MNFKASQIEHTSKNTLKDIPAVGHQHFELNPGPFFSDTLILMSHGRKTTKENFKQ